MLTAGVSTAAGAGQRNTLTGAGLMVWRSGILSQEEGQYDKQRKNKGPRCATYPSATRRGRLGPAVESRSGTLLLPLDNKATAGEEVALPPDTTIEARHDRVRGGAPLWAAGGGVANDTSHGSQSGGTEGERDPRRAEWWRQLSRLDSGRPEPPRQRELVPLSRRSHRGTWSLVPG